jgi:hypothetical protein
MDGGRGGHVRVARGGFCSGAGRAGLRLPCSEDRPVRRDMTAGFEVDTCEAMAETRLQVVWSNMKATHLNNNYQLSMNEGISYKMRRVNSLFGQFK